MDVPVDVHDEDGVAVFDNVCVGEDVVVFVTDALTDGDTLLVTVPVSEEVEDGVTLPV